MDNVVRNMSEINKNINIYMLCCKWYLKKKTSLPLLYYALNSKRGIAVSTLRCLEKSVMKTAKKMTDIMFLQFFFSVFPDDGQCCPKHVGNKKYKNLHAVL